jgi:hypothetical protein
VIWGGRAARRESLRRVACDVTAEDAPGESSPLQQYSDLQN